MKKKLLRPGIVKVTKPHTAQEIVADTQKRLSLVNKEFSEGLQFVGKYAKSVTFFGSSMFPHTNPYYQRARKLAQRISKLGYTVVTGGGPGIMEAANFGAYESGGQSIGLNIKLPNEQNRNDYLTDSYEFYYFFSRKVALTFAAEAYVFFPGGYGTLDEFFELILLVQTHRLVPTPIILTGSEFWKPLDEFIRAQVYARHSMIEESALSIYTITDSDDTIIELIQKAPLITTVPFHPQEK